MAHTIPANTADWLAEVLENLEVAAMAAAGEGLDSDPEQTHWVQFMRRQALLLSREARGLGEDHDDPEVELGELDAVDDLARNLRRAAPGSPRDVVSEAQIFLLFYLAAHVHARLISQPGAAALVSDCWAECAGEDEDRAGAADGEAEGEELEDEDDLDEPWPITLPPPQTPVAWAEEIISAYSRSACPPPLSLGAEQPFEAAPGSLLEAATVLALANRGVRPPPETVEQLVDTIGAMEEDVRGMGPEWESMQRIPALAFAMYYVWVHLAIGAADEDQAMGIMQECTARIGEFTEPARRDQSGGRGRRG
jgi:hypothetical protein